MCPLDGMSLGTITRDDGRYTLTVPAARVNGQTASLVARLIGYKSASVPITLSAGAPITHDFVLVSNPLKLGEIVITGAGTSSSAEKLGHVRHHVDSTDIENIEILKGAAAGALYGARAGQGVILITTKSGKSGATRYSMQSKLSFDDLN